MGGGSTQPLLFFGFRVHGSYYRVKERFLGLHGAIYGLHSVM